MDEFHAESERDEQKEIYINENDVLKTETERGFMDGLVSGVRQYMPEIDVIIDKNLSGWRFERVFKTDLTILRIAIYELLHTDTSEKVIINEAVEMAKKYCDDDSVAFINGLLGMVYKEEKHGREA
jgi:N utilization substance protein B